MKNNRVQIEPFIDDKTEEYDYKILIYGKRGGLGYIDFNRHFLKNLIYPNAWLSIIYFIFRISFTIISIN